MMSINNDIRVRRSSRPMPVIAAVALASLLVSLFASLVPYNVSAATNLFSDGFESSYTAWTSGTPENGKWEIDNSGHTGKAARIKGGNTPSKYLYKNITTTGYQNIVLSYWYKANDLETSSSWPWHDDIVRIQYSTDNGSNWNTLFTISDSNDDDNWHLKSHTLPATAENLSTLKIRVYADFDGGSDNVWIDDVLVDADHMNQPPTASNASATTDEDTPAAIALIASDSDVPAQALTYTVGSPSHGVLSGTAPSLTYTPAANYNGSDSFTFSVNDGMANSPTRTISITVNPVNDAPAATAASVSTHVDTALAIVLTGTDVDGDTLTFATTSEPTNGTLSGIAPNLTYTPNSAYVGTDSFTFSVTDGSLSSSATVTITVDNGAPTLAAIADQVVDELVALSLTAVGTDPDSDPLTYSLTDLGSTGAAIDSTTGVFSWTPSEAQGAGVYQFTVTVSDGLLTDSKNFQVTVNEVNVAPATVDQAVSTAQDTAVSGTLIGTDADLPANTLTFATTSNPTNGTLTVDANTGAFTYTPNSGFVGNDTFNFAVSDGTLTSTVDGVVSITVTAAPVVVVPPTPPAPTGNGGGSGGNGGGGGVVSGPLSIGFVNTNNGGQVLGASTELPNGCSAYLNEYLKKGSTNASEVKKLQSFLNEEMGSSLPVTGIFGQLTFNAVSAFQAKYASDVLKPWFDQKLSSDMNPSGYVYKMTKHKINLIKCASLNTPVPQLP